MKRIDFPAMAGMAALLLGGCGPKPNLHPEYSQRRPKYVLVLPPENLTGNNEVEETVYPIIYEKLARRGYYCLAPELTRGIFNANKLEDAGRIHQLPPQKFKEIFGVDAIFKVRVTDWSSKYVVISSTVNVGFQMELVDTESGELLWSMERVLSKAPGGSGQGGILAALLETALHAALTPYEPIAEENAKGLIGTIPEGEYFGKW